MRNSFTVVSFHKQWWYLDGMLYYMAKDGIYKTTHCQMVPKRHAFFRVAPAPLLLLPLLLIMVVNFNYDDTIENEM